MLVQAFAEPGWNPEVPPEIKQTLHGLSPDLDRAIENAKLIELVSRREMAAELAAEFHSLYGLGYDRADPQSTTPIYQYFLPAQAAHVIRTSVHARRGKPRARCGISPSSDQRAGSARPIRAAPPVPRHCAASVSSAP